MEKESKKTSWEEEIYWKHFHSVSFHLVLPSDFHHHLILPKKFTDKMRGNLPEKVALKGPNEVSWNINLVKAEDGTMFKGEAWKEFVKAYSLKKTDILVFKYNRSECFEVLFFDGTNLCEKEGSYFVRKSQSKPQNDCTAKATENSTEEFTDRSQDADPDYSSRYRFRRKTGRTPRSCSSGRTARARAADRLHGDRLEEPHVSDEENSSSEEQNSIEIIDGTPKKSVGSRRDVASNSSRKRKRSTGRKTVGNRKQQYIVWYESNRRPVTEAEKEKALVMAQEKASNHENSFYVIMRPSSVYKRFFVSIPSGWNPKQIFKKHEEVILRVKEKTWVCNFCSGSNNGGFQGGWKQFVTDNFLEEFDVCLFVPDNKMDGMYVLDVTIFRVVPEIVPPTVLP